MLGETKAAKLLADAHPFDLSVMSGRVSRITDELHAAAAAGRLSAVVEDGEVDRLIDVNYFCRSRCLMRNVTEKSTLEIVHR